MTSEGPNSPGTCESIDQGNDDWSNPTNGASQSDSYASCDPSADDNTDIFRLTNFSFNIPSGTVDGITVEVDHYSEQGVPDDDYVKLVSGAVAVGDNKGNGGGMPNSDTDSYSSYGGAADDWNAGFGYEDVNNSTFGVEFYYNNDHNTQRRSIYVDHVRITINYTEAGAAPGLEFHMRPIGRGIGRNVMR